MNHMIDALNHDTDFQTLIKKYESPNCFNIMGRTRREEWHSNFVCWLLDPSSNHNLGNFPLKMFFELINKNLNDEINIDEIDFDQTIFKTEVSIENGRIDILGESEKFILIIENKLDARETYNAKEKNFQTDVYFKYFDEKEDYKKKQKYYVYLRTKSGNRPSNKNFIPITYQELFDEVIFKCIHCENITDETRFVLEQYALSISNPNSEGTHMAYTEKIIAEKLYEKYESVIEHIRSTMDDTNRDEKSDICVFFEKYQRYLNEILGAIDESPITKRTESSRIDIGNAFLKLLCDRKIVIPDKTELIFERKRFGVTYIIQIGMEKGKYYCQAGYYQGKYTGKEFVQAIENGKESTYTFDTINSAAQKVESKYKEKTRKEKRDNDGAPAGQFTVIHSGKIEAEGKTIEEIKREFL